MNVVDSSCWLEYLMGTEIGAVVAPDSAVVFSCDKHFKDIPDVRYFPLIR